MAGGYELTGDLKAEPSVRSGDERRRHVRTIRNLRKQNFQPEQAGVVWRASFSPELLIRVGRASEISPK
jgi:hypothetical protein